MSDQDNGQDYTEEDTQVLANMVEMLENASEEEVKRFCSGTLKAATLGQQVFKRRFPYSWRVWDAHVNKHGQVPE